MAAMDEGPTSFLGESAVPNLDDPVLEQPIPDGDKVEDGDEQMPTFFQESDECANILRDAATSLPLSWTETVPNTEAVVASLARFEKCLQKYQEFPQLIGAYLGPLVEPLMNMVVERLPSSAHLVEQQREQESADEGGKLLAAQGGPAAAATAAETGLGGGAGCSADGVLYDAYDMDAPRTPLHHICRCLYVVVKVAGPKACTSHFPHDVRLFEHVCYALMYWHRTPALKREWEVRYCLLLWLCNLILVPFAIHTIDSSLRGQGDDASEQLSLSSQLFALALDFLHDTSRCREAAALLIARFLTRADGGQHRGQFVQVTSEWIANEACPAISLHGMLQALATTLKLGKRRELLSHAVRLIPLVTRVIELRHSDAKLCKTAVKAVQRLGLCLLRQKRAPWRYVKRVASLEVNLQESTRAGVSTTPMHATTEAANEREDDAGATDDAVEGDGLEDVVGILIQSLSHPDTIVRWSAAKGIGRLCNRLPKALADDVVDAFLAVFDVKENDAGWHGAMLALAELCRASILLPSRFDAVTPLIAEGLTYDMSRGTYSVGSHVRDAACYVCWSVARAYDAMDLEPYVYRLSTSLVVAALYDREVNVRRAASAALQECVGRLGNFPNGIELVTTMDFFSLATMRGAYLHVAPLVARHEAYRKDMIDALVEVKLKHWDKEVRRTAAKSLGLIAPLCPETITTDVVSDRLLAKVRDATLATRHGAICAIAECVANLPCTAWSADQVTAIATIVPYLDAGRHFRGRGGELLRQACLRLLEAVALQATPLPEFIYIEKVSGERAKARTLAKLQVFFEDTWKQILEWLQGEAAAAFEIFARQYYRAATYSEAFHGKMIQQMLDNSVEGKASALERRGTVLALGSLPVDLLLIERDGGAGARAAAAVSTTGPSSLEGGPAAPTLTSFFSATIRCLLRAAIPEANPEVRDAETRRNAVHSLVQLCTSVLAIPDPRVHAAAFEPQHDPTLWRDTLDVLCHVFDDYAVDKRGDVGSFVRVQAMRSCQLLISRLAQTRLTEVNRFLLRSPVPSKLIHLVGLILQQTTEKIDKVRGVGGHVLSTLLEDRTVFEFLSAQLCELCPAAAPGIGSDGCGGEGRATEVMGSQEGDLVVLHRCFVESGIQDWSSPSELFSVVVPPLLETAIFAPYVMEGLVVSVGGLSVHVLKPSFASLEAAFRTSKLPSRLSFLLIRVAAKHVHDDRFVVPLCLTIDRLMNVNLFDPERWNDLLDIIVAETRHYSTDIQKLLPLVGVLGTLCRAPQKDVREAAWMLCLNLIASRFPKVRAKTGTELYTALLFLSSSSDGSSSGSDQLHAAMDHISRHVWDDSNATAVRSARNELYGLLGLEKPSKDSDGMKAQPAVARRSKPNSYSYLVHEAGY